MPNIQNRCMGSAQATADVFPAEHTRFGVHEATAGPKPRCAGPLCSASLSCTCPCHCSHPRPIRMGLPLLVPVPVPWLRCPTPTPSPPHRRSPKSMLLPSQPRPMPLFIPLPLNGRLPWPNHESQPQIVFCNEPYRHFRVLVTIGKGRPRHTHNCQVTGDTNLSANKTRPKQRSVPCGTPPSPCPQAPTAAACRSGPPMN